MNGGTPRPITQWYQEAQAGGSFEFETSPKSIVRSAWKQNLDIHFTAKECLSVFIRLLFSKLHQVYKGMSARNVTVKSVGVIWSRNILSSLIPTYTMSVLSRGSSEEFLPEAWSLPSLVTVLSPSPYMLFHLHNPTSWWFWLYKWCQAAKKVLPSRTTHGDWIYDFSHTPPADHQVN